VCNSAQADERFLPRRYPNPEKKAATPHSSTRDLLPLAIQLIDIIGVGEQGEVFQRWIVPHRSRPSTAAAGPPRLAGRVTIQRPSTSPRRSVCFRRRTPSAHNLSEDNGIFGCRPKEGVRCKIHPPTRPILANTRRGITIGPAGLWLVSDSGSCQSDPLRLSA
jgi:hypothetical protein